MALDVGSPPWSRHIWQQLAPATGPLRAPVRPFSGRWPLAIRYEQDKRPLRPGDALKAYRVLAGVSIDQLLIAGGHEGTSLAEKILSDVRSAFKNSMKGAELR